MILLNAHAGLCNKLLAIGAGLHLAEETHQPLHVFWITDVHMDVLFTDLFERPSRFSLHQLRVPQNHIARGGARRIASFLFPGLGNGARGFLDYEPTLIESAKTHPRSIHRIMSFREFYPTTDYRWLKPKQEILDRVSACESLTAGNITGVHIRRGDHQQAMRCSPLHLFYERISRDVAADATQMFFLCTDAPEVKADLMRKYPRNIVSREMVLARHEKGGVADAVVDLWLLSKCRKIYGTYPSSFSLVASKIGNAAFEWIRDVEQQA